MYLNDYFVLEILLRYYDEFTEDNFYFAFNKYFSQAKNKDQIKELLIKYLFDIKLTKEDIEMMVLLKEKKMTNDDIEEDIKNWVIYQLPNNQKKVTR